MIRDLGNLVVDMILFCPKCGMQHIDKPDDDVSLGSGPMPARRMTAERWTNPPHRSHLCHGCGHIWRPSDVHTNGVAKIRSKGVNDSPLVEPLEAWGVDVRLGSQMYVAHSNQFRNGTLIVTIKRKPR